MILSCSACWSLYYTHELLALLCFSCDQHLVYLVILTADPYQMSVEFFWVEFAYWERMEEIWMSSCKDLESISPMGVIELMQVNYSIKDRFSAKNRQPHGLAAKHHSQVFTHLAVSQVRSSYQGDHCPAARRQQVAFIPRAFGKGGGVQIRSQGDMSID